MSDELQNLKARTSVMELMREAQTARTPPVVPLKEDAYDAMERAHQYSETLDKLLTAELGNESAEALLKAMLEQEVVGALVEARTALFLRAADIWIRMAKSMSELHRFRAATEDLDTARSLVYQAGHAYVRERKAGGVSTHPFELPPNPSDLHWPRTLFDERVATARLALASATNENEQREAISWIVDGVTDYASQQRLRQPEIVELLTSTLSESLATKSTGKLASLISEAFKAIIYGIVSSGLFEVLRRVSSMNPDATHTTAEKIWTKSWAEVRKTVSDEDWEVLSPDVPVEAVARPLFRAILSSPKAFDAELR